MNDREMLAKLNFCRMFLHIQGFLTEAENENVFKRLKKFQDKKKIEVSHAQMLSIEMSYDDNAKEE